MTFCIILYHRLIITDVKYTRYSRISSFYIIALFLINISVWFFSFYVSTDTSLFSIFYFCSLSRCFSTDHLATDTSLLVP